ncbi:MAG: hypothetical protein Q9M82_00880 [Mariprofundus sp.]|nr:hypothetical protein [Mariprofundus sp.]
MDRTNSMGLWTYAKEYLDAAKIVASSSDRELAPTPAYYLVCHSIELILKAFLRGSGEELEDLKKIGHNLKRCLNKAEKKGITEYFCFTGIQKQAVSLINDYYSQKEFEYISTGFKTFPKYDILEEISSGLLSSLKGYCRKNMNIHDETI